MTKTNDPKVGAAQKELRSAFDDLIADLQAARDTIDDPQFFPPAATERVLAEGCLLYTSPSPRDRTRSRMPSSA